MGLADEEVIVDPDGVPASRKASAAVLAAAWVAATAITLVAAPGGAACVPPYGDPEVGTFEGSPLGDLPSHISLVVPFGQRPDWSRDGRTLVFLDRANDGNIWTVDVATGATRNLTGGFTNYQGFSRAHFLRNGDVLLCGPTSGPRPTPERPEDGRFNGVLWVAEAGETYRVQITRGSGSGGSLVAVVTVPGPEVGAAGAAWGAGGGVGAEVRAAARVTTP